VERLADGDAPSAGGRRGSSQRCRPGGLDHEGFQKTVISELFPQLIHRLGRKRAITFTTLIAAFQIAPTGQHVTPSVLTPPDAAKVPPTGRHAHRADRRRALRPDGAPAVTSHSVSTRSAASSAAASVPPPSQKTRVSPASPSAANASVTSRCPPAPEATSINRAPVPPRGARLLRRLPPVDQPDRNLPRRARQVPLQRQVQPPRQHHAHGLRHVAEAAHRQHRIVARAVPAPTITASWLPAAHAPSAARAAR
jgi:hypothetical protein